MIEKTNIIIDKRKLRDLINQLDIGFYSNDIFYIKYKRMNRIYYFNQFPFIYCIVEIKLKNKIKNISKNIIESTYRYFRKHFEYYKL